MPAERRQKTLKQSTIFGFAKPIVSAPTSAGSTQGCPARSNNHVPVAAAADSEVMGTSTLPAKREGLEAKPQSSSNPKLKVRAKAGDEDRSRENVVLCIKPQFTQLISERKKNHEYRKYRLKESVKYLWLYETAPTSAITYVMSTTKPKVPGEVNDSSGIGNDDFDQGLKQSKYGYPVTALWRLKKPLTATQLKERFGIAVPQGWRYATRNLVEELPLQDMDKVF